MGEVRKYTSGTHAALMSLCRGTCYWPTCDEPVTKLVDGEHILNLEIAHIRAVSSGGKRFDQNMTLNDRNDFKNLLLLCKAHHIRVDGRDSDQYTVKMLQTWKKDRESDGLDALQGIRGLTEDRFRELVSESFESFFYETNDALTELAKIAPEAASTLRVLVDELSDPRVHGFGVDPDAAWALQTAAHDLRGLEDNARTLRDAADDLRGLEDNAGRLSRAANSLRGLEDLPGQLEDAARQIRNARGDY
ncbi:HNH endonuclease signature motif containing protein [Streptomyces sp. NPDC058657]|uniref:HNH endonuclease signature motif containing protein n=1 Tax=unclassified Streptomyces TaxID=2593676 RepID=UPI00365CD28E